MTSLIEVLIVIVIGGLLCALLVVTYQNESSPKFELIKHEWQCVEEVEHTMLIPINGTLMPMTQKTCVEYKKL